MNEGGETVDLTNDERAALAVLDDMTLAARETYNAALLACNAAESEYERASMAAALVVARRALAAEAEAERLRDDPAKDDTDEAHPAWWRGYNADKGELAQMADEANARAVHASALVIMIEAERDEARTKMHAAEAEVTRLRAENATLRASTDAAVDGVRAMLPAALKVAREEAEAAAREWAASVCERMVVGGCAWSEEQAIAGRALLAAAVNIRTLPIAAHYEVKP